MSAIKTTIFGASMLGLGAVGGYFFAKKTLQDQYQEDLVDVQNFYKEKLDELGVMPEDFGLSTEDTVDLLRKFSQGYKEGLATEADTESDGDEDKEDEEESEKIVNIYRGKGRQRINYSKPDIEDLNRIRKEYEVLAADAEPEEEYEPSEDEGYEAEIEARAEEYAQIRKDNMASGRPYLIDSDEYADTEAYEHQVLYYYSEDGVLCEDDDAIVEEEEECVGLDYEEVLRMQTTCWVRNDNLGMVYEIHRINASYNKTVKNAVETPREREFRLQGRRRQAMDD